jgi:hypothetical protein
VQVQQQQVSRSLLRIQVHGWRRAGDVGAKKKKVGDHHHQREACVHSNFPFNSLTYPILHHAVSSFNTKTKAYAYDGMSKPSLIEPNTGSTLAFTFPADGCNRSVSFSFDSPTTTQERVRSQLQSSLICSPLLQQVTPGRSVVRSKADQIGAVVIVLFFMAGLARIYILYVYLKYAVVAVALVNACTVLADVQ